MRIFERRIRLNLALQGGGAHGAFTWGVLDRFLEEDRIEYGTISATSAGAVNAVAMAAGLHDGGHAGARERLRQIWEGVYNAGVPDLLKINPFLYGLSRSGAMAQVASLWSPYQFNPLDFNPLRGLLNDTIDFARLRETPGVELLVAATEVSTGRARLFRRKALTVESVLASACLPTMHHAIEIDGEAFWDGGFSANPDLVTLALESPVRDTLIVQINPLVQRGMPRSVREIAAQANRMTFNAPLIRDIEIIEAVRETGRGLFGVRKGRLAPLAWHRYHLVEAGRYTAGLAPDSKMKTDWGMLSYLCNAGRQEAEKWLMRHRHHVGRRSSVDLKRRYLKANAAEDQVPFIVPPKKWPDSAPVVQNAGMEGAIRKAS